ncbi:MAG: acyl-CoA thioesterase [Opitutales bacterium]
MFEHTITVQVRYAETDQMGFVYHANYLAWFEMARVRMLDALELSYRQLEAEGAFLPVLEANVRYRQPAYFDDLLTVQVRLPEKPRVRIRLEYQVLRDEALLAEGFTQHAWIGKEGRSIRPPDSWRQKLDALFQPD